MPSDPNPLASSRSTRRFRRSTGWVPEVALLLSTYEKPWSLRRALESVAVQRGVDGRFELVVTDDGSTDDTPDIVQRFAASVPFSVTLTSHPHTGFQLARCRNQGAAASKAPYLVFLDGDCVLPPDHVRKHLDLRQAGRVMCGYCYRLCEATTARFDDRVIRSYQFAHWVSRDERRAMNKRRRKASFYQFLRHPNKPRLTGGNFGICREDYERVNGFDEGFEGWGGEDTDLGFRLRRAGVKIHSILKWTQSYHLWHPPDPTAPDRIRNGMNEGRLHRRGRLTKCRNGLIKRSPEDLEARVVGVPDQPDVANSLLSSWRADMSLADSGQQRERPEAEVLFLPGKGRFSGRADCNVLVVLEASKRASRLARKAHVVVTDEPPGQMAVEFVFPLDGFRQAMNTLG